MADMQREYSRTPSTVVDPTHLLGRLYTLRIFPPKPILLSLRLHYRICDKEVCMPAKEE